MATTESLVKYYDCLRESFNKIQAKDNETALVNAALRPKIREEFSKSTPLLESYLEYIKVFSLIYSDKFITICSNILVPLFKENPVQTLEPDGGIISGTDFELGKKIHEAIRSIIDGRPELAKDFVHSLIRAFPSISDECNKSNTEFTNYLGNFLEISATLDEQSLQMAISCLIDKINPLHIDTNNYESDLGTKTLKTAYQMIYRQLEIGVDGHKLIKAFIAAHVHEYIAQPALEEYKYFLLYICSCNADFATSMLESLWSVFIDGSRSIEDREASAIFAASLISRATYIDLDETFRFLEETCQWCLDFLDRKDSKITYDSGSTNENHRAFLSASQSVFYVITQRFREMYEDENIDKLNKLHLDRIINCKLEPLEWCDAETRRRFLEVATLFQLANIDQNPIKKRKLDQGSSKPRSLRPPFRDCCQNLPARIKPLYRSYYDHRNFTVYRE